jgi:hypothetical protein
MAIHMTLIGFISPTKLQLELMTIGSAALLGI